jgi:hypothetical protein
MKNLIQIYQYKILLVIFIIILPIEKNNCQSGNAKSLEIDNQWVWYFQSYMNSYYTYETVTSDTIINNVEYAIINSNFYERADSNIVYYYNPPDSSERISLNYNWPIGYIVDPDPSNYTIVTNKSITSLWGKTLRKICIYKSYYGFAYSNNWYTEWIGLTSRDGHGPGTDFTVTLKAAKIENYIYGDTTLLGTNPEIDELPAEYKLYQNYPNPFNPVTTIKYSVTKTSKISLVVYDILGREIATLVNEEKLSGNYTVQFNASNFSSGVYFYVLRADNFVDSKKLILLK